jgi:serine/threonine-protein kinase
VLWRLFSAYGVILSKESPPKPLATVTTIAVLPFVNVSAEKETEYFADGLTDEVTNALTKLESVRVVARTSAFQFKGKARDVRRIGAELNVSTLLEGSVRKSGKSLRVMVQLIDVQYGYETWSDIYDCELDSGFAIQLEIAKAILNALRIADTGGRAPPFAKQYTRSLEAYNPYLAALYHVNQWTPEDLLRAIEQFERSITVDPRFAPAYSGLASGYATLLEWHLLPPSEGLSKAQIAAETALAIDNHLAQAHAALATVNALGWRWTRAKAEFERAIENDPSDADVRRMYATNYLLPMNRLDDALAEGEMAVKLDPLSPVVNMSMAKIRYVRREYQAAIDQYIYTLGLRPNLRSAYWDLGAAYAKRSQFEQAVNTVTRVKGPPDDTAVIASAGYIYGLTGRVADARAKAVQLEKIAERQYVPSYYKALIYLGVGDKSRSLECLEKAYAERDPSLIYLAVTPDWDGVRSDPRFRTLLDQIGLPKL